MKQEQTFMSSFLFGGTIRFEKSRDCDIEELDQGQHWSLQMHSQQRCGTRQLHSGGQDAL